MPSVIGDFSTLLLDAPTLVSVLWEPSGVVNFLNGTGPEQVDAMFRRAGTLESTGTPKGADELELDLLGGNGERDVLNNTLPLAKVRYMWLVLTDPAAGEALHFGPLALGDGAIPDGRRRGGGGGEVRADAPGRRLGRPPDEQGADAGEPIGRGGGLRVGAVRFERVGFHCETMYQFRTMNARS